MKRYRIASMNGENIAAVVTQEEFAGGPPVGSTVPADPGQEYTDPQTGEPKLAGGNRDWLEFLAWQAAGNTPDPLEG